jgi:hypothetical protein
VKKPQAESTSKIQTGVFAVTEPGGAVTFPMTEWLTLPDDAEHALTLAREQFPDLPWDSVVPLEEYA